MNLFQILLNLDDFPNHYTIYAMEPWTLESEAQVVLEPSEGLIQLAYNNEIFEYFLEITSAKALLLQLGSQNLCTQVQCQRVIEYAIANS
ncbi:hypothetical protein B9T33_08890 [Acinetobacter sp. ANC 5054]|uniref:hypothetical protein n=1 Tax=Acinetobacter sp. ANC 5054 TaxID=1977877 RepID=UPI000A3578EA|nr:hypothetical protein [Acinetobacter sp. ANC 5054]OTG80535.1 hypothetical protein B9T33_08890 [Acinetobacter sp. ANC 5054]